MVRQTLAASRKKIEKLSNYLFVFRNIDPRAYMNKNENRGKRGVLHLYNMLYCATGCDPLSYKGYGCYCGFLGEGRPTDGIDRLVLKWVL